MKPQTFRIVLPTPREDEFVRADRVDLTPTSTEFYRNGQLVASYSFLGMVGWQVEESLWKKVAKRFVRIFGP